MKSKTTVTTLLVCAVIIILALAFYFGQKIFYPPTAKVEKESAVIVNGEKPPSEPEKQEVARLKLPAPLVEKEVTEIVKEPARAEESPSVSKTERERLSDEMKAFFDYLDGKGYAEAYQLKKGTQHEFEKKVSELLLNPPVIVGETKDIYVLTRNMAHIYRVIKKNNILLSKEVLDKEREITEAAFGLFYEWLMEEERNPRGRKEVTLENLYEYGAYFLQTLSGKAYMIRRDSKTRMLVTYYSILVVHEADEKRKNRYGIDIIPPLNLLLEDMNNYKGLDEKDKYITELKKIRRNVVRNRS